jgi:ATP-binding cassette subfamily F protein uup
MITGRVAPTGGEIEIGQTVHIGYYDQQSRLLNDEQRVIDYIRDEAEYVTTSEGVQITAGKMLERFLFEPAAQYAVIGNLSGGERRRLYLLRILMGSPNVLLLDEPTNDLDIPTLIALEEYLDDFAGALIVVSHDRYFLDRTVDSIFHFEPGGRVREYPGDYTAYLAAHERELSEKKAETPAPVSAASRIEPEPHTPVAQKTKAKKLSFKEMREFESLETRIGLTEKRLPEIEKELAAAASDAGRVHELFTEQQSLNTQLKTDLNRWAELAERVES